MLAPTSSVGTPDQEGRDVAIREHRVVVDDEAEIGVAENVLELPARGSGG